MAIKEQDKVFYEELANGDKVINLPITRANNVEGLGRSANTAYVVGDVVYVDNNKKIALKCTIAGITSNTELEISENNVGDTVTDGSVVWQVCNRTSDVTSVNGKTGDVVVDLPVGFMYVNFEKEVPVGRLPAIGATYNRALYADLWAWANSVGLVKTESEWQAIASANDGNCAYYSSGDGSTTFRVPSIKCWVKGASSVDEVGSYLEAGLPNIEGTLSTISAQSSNNPVSGCFGNQRTTNWKISNDGENDYAVDFNASWSNPIYGNSATVQPPSLVGQWLIVAFGVAHNIGNADVANVMQAVETAQTSVQNVDNKIIGISDYIVESYRNGTEWYEVYKSGKVRQGGLVSGSSTSYVKNITFLKPFAKVDYTIYGAYCSNNSADSFTIAVVANAEETNITTTGFKVRISANRGHKYWVTEGQGA